jgi:bifunctional UDP-N-acetylglucosamine pyrophosphorylase/glucosamine-1-phosphate N-acetyltransferase
MPDLHTVILAAGKGTRMKSARPKVLHELAGLPLVEHVLRTADRLSARRTVLVVGHGADDVRQALASRVNLEYVVQSPQLGTGHAVLQTEPLLRAESGTVLLLYADVPLLQPETLHRLVERHRTTGAAATVLTAAVPDPHGYGRVVRDADGRMTRIVEERDASADERRIDEINSGIYALELGPLFDALRSLASDNAQGEYYLTDLVAMYARSGLRVETLQVDDAQEVRGVNSRVELADMARVLLDRKRRALMLDGVTLEDPSTTYVELDVEVGADTTLGPGVTLTGATRIGERCRVQSGCRLTDARIEDEATVLDHSVIVRSVVRAGASVGPFAHLRPGSDVGEGAKVGNFVELKKTRLGPRSKAGHLSYLGDATIGADVNIGAGTITCNYDGLHKHETTIEDGVFVGSDTQLIAPVTIGRNAYIGAGSSITENVPEDALAVARGRQANKPGWARARRARDRSHGKPVKEHSK